MEVHASSIRVAPWSIIALTLLLAFTTGHVFPTMSDKRSTVESSPQTYNLNWSGFDWDGRGEVTLELNGQFLASLPTTESPQNSQTYTPFSLDITTLIVAGSNTLVFTHASWDCGVVDSVKNLEIDTQMGVIFKSSTVDPLGCSQPLTYNFTVTTSTPPPSTQPSYTLNWMGFDWDGGGEERVSLNGRFVASL
ncbi:MAG TPA: hypothetical protein VE955_06710, partial [Candidatus Dormibacteraeota bacterium]|nr:hypothetical protein [Candidatus Dormibacteraeota bacterium]